MKTAGVQAMLAAVLAAKLIALAAPAAAQEGVWTTETPLPVPTGQLGLAAYGNLLFAIGGGTESGYPGNVFAYDPSGENGGTWSSRASMLKPRASAAVVLAGGLLYAIGGEEPVPDSSCCATVEAYDPEPTHVGTYDTWQFKPSLLTTHNHFGAAVVNGVIYAVSGRNLSGFVADVEAYDTNAANPQWTLKAPIPTPREFMAVAELNGKLYAVGGTVGDSNSPVATVEIFDPSTGENGSWTSGPPMNHPRLWATAAALNGFLYVAGGSACCTTYLDTVEVYDPSTGQWTDLEDPLPQPRAALGMTAFNGQVYAVGGHNEEGPIGSVPRGATTRYAKWLSPTFLGRLLPNVLARMAYASEGPKVVGANTRFVPNGTPCDDGDPCTHNDAYQAGSCVGSFDPFGTILADPTNVSSDLEAVQCLISELSQGHLPPLL